MGGRRCIPELADSYGVEEVIIAMPSIPGSVIREILDLCATARVPARTMPGLHNILSGTAGLAVLGAGEARLQPSPVRAVARADGVERLADHEWQRPGWHTVEISVQGKTSSGAVT